MVEIREGRVFRQRGGGSRELSSIHRTRRFKTQNKSLPLAPGRRGSLERAGYISEYKGFGKEELRNM